MKSMKYNEEEILLEVLAYIKGTYGEHYAHSVTVDAAKKEGIQVFDLWEALDIAIPTCQATAIKYISRYGRKEGHNKKDLLKAIHYILMLWYYTQEKTTTPRNSPELLNENLVGIASAAYETAGNLGYTGHLGDAC